MRWSKPRKIYKTFTFPYLVNSVFRSVALVELDKPLTHRFLLLIGVGLIAATAVLSKPKNNYFYIYKTRKTGMEISFCFKRKIRFINYMSFLHTNIILSIFPLILNYINSPMKMLIPVYQDKTIFNKEIWNCTTIILVYYYNIPPWTKKNSNDTTTHLPQNAFNTYLLYEVYNIIYTFHVPLLENLSSLIKVSWSWKN